MMKQKELQSLNAEEEEEEPLTSYIYVNAF